VLSYSPDGSTEALESMTRLLHRPEWRDSGAASALRARLTARLASPDRHLRYLAIIALPAVHTDPADLSSALAARIDAETDVDVLTTALSVLDRVLPCELADPILATVADARTAGPSITELIASNDDPDLHELRHTWVAVHLNCALQASTPQANASVNAWFSEPAKAGLLFKAAATSLRRPISFNTADPVRNKAFDLIRTAAASLNAGLTATPNDASTVLAADALVEQLYFSSGAFDKGNDGSRPTADQRDRWFNDAMGALEDLTAVRHPHSCYQLLETFEFIIDENPARVFRAVAATIKDDSDFRYEPMGTEIAVRIVEHYLAEYRELFITQPYALAELRRVLEVFATVGWPAAVNLSYSLGDVFR
jgi:hypothetical protein